MRLSQSSQTAEYMAFFRALESARPANTRLFNDPFALHFLRAPLRRAVLLSRTRLAAACVNWYSDLRIPGARTSAIARTKLIDDALGDALRTGISQVVILGAGFDCRAYRLPQLDAATVFEIDHPATLSSKLDRLRAVLPGLPGNVHYIEIDFMREVLPEALARAGFQLSHPAVFIWEGVSHYLNSEAVDSVFRFVASCAPATQIIFTYVHAGMLDGSVIFKAADRLLRDFAKIGEPWVYGMFPDRVVAFLGDRGLCLDRDLSAREYRALYLGRATHGMQGYDFYHVAVAHVPKRSSSRGKLHGVILTY